MLTDRTHTTAHAHAHAPPHTVQLLGEANEYIEKENLEYYHGRGVTLRLRPEVGDRVHMVVNISTGYSSTEDTERPPAADPDAYGAELQQQTHKEV